MCCCQLRLGRLQVWILCSLVRIPRSWLLWKYFNSMAMKLEVNAKTLQVSKQAWLSQRICRLKAPRPAHVSSSPVEFSAQCCWTLWK